MKQKIVLYYEIGDFCVEAEWEKCDGEATAEFWLCRKGWGVKTYMFGIPKHEIPEGKIENAFAEYIALFCDRSYMDCYLEDMIEGDELVTDEFKIMNR